MSYSKAVNNIPKIQSKITEENLFNAEADSYHCFELFLSTMKSNYIQGFDGINQNLERLTKMMQKCNKKLMDHFEKNHLEIFHFAFRWILCLLFREFPINLAIKLLDYYLVEEYYPNELCTYLSAALLMRFSFDLMR